MSKVQKSSPDSRSPDQVTNGWWLRGYVVVTHPAVETARRRRTGRPYFDVVAAASAASLIAVGVIATTAFCARLAKSNR